MKKDQKIEKVKDEDRKTPKKINRERVKHTNEVIYKTKLMKGVNNTKEQIRDRKYNEYCKSYNVKNNTEIKNTAGGWKSRKKWCSTKSQWQYETEDKISNGLGEKEKEIKYKNRETIILYDMKNREVKPFCAELEKTVGQNVYCKARVWTEGTKKVNVFLRKLFPMSLETEMGEVKYEDGIIPMEEFYKTIIKTGVNIYVVEEMYI